MTEAPSPNSGLCLPKYISLGRKADNALANTPRKAIVDGENDGASLIHHHEIEGLHARHLALVRGADLHWQEKLMQVCVPYFAGFVRWHASAN